MGAQLHHPGCCFIPEMFAHLSVDLVAMVSGPHVKDLRWADTQTLGYSVDMYPRATGMPSLSAEHTALPLAFQEY